jgi:hypothetical protein
MSREPPASKYLTRVHDGESLEDLKPWRARGVELFIGEDALDVSARATRGWEHLPLPECVPSTSKELDDSAPIQDDDVNMSPRLYTAVLRAVLTSPPSEDALIIAEAIREALGLSKETHDAALAVAMSPQTSKLSAPAAPEPGSESQSVTPRSVANDTMEEVADANGAIVEIVEFDETNEEPAMPPGGIFACCFGGAAKAPRKTSSSPTAPEKKPELPKIEPQEISVARTLAPEAPALVLTSAPATAVDIEVARDEELHADEVTEGCAMLARALWLGWRRAGGAATGGPLETHEPVGTTKDVSHPTTLPSGWHNVLTAFAERHGASEVAVALAESMAIARTDDVLSTAELDKIHVHLATATSAIASGRAAKTESALRDVVANALFPVMVRALRACLAPDPGADVDDTVARIRALAPTVALCMPLDTPASRFAGVVNRAAARAATDRVEKCLTTSLPGEANARITDVFVAVREEDDAERDARDSLAERDASKVARCQTEVADDVPDALYANVLRDAATPTFTRVTEAAKIAVECFPLDLAAFGALPPGVSAASVASHATASTLARAATAATRAVGGMCATPYGTAFQALDGALMDLRGKMRAENLGSSATPLGAGREFDQNVRLAMEETLVVLRPRLGAALRDASARERGGKKNRPLEAVAPDRGAMHSSSLADSFAALRDAYAAALPDTIERRRDVFAREHALGVETLIGGALRWYAEEHESACLSEVRTARARLWDESRGAKASRDSDAGDAAMLTRQFHTRLSNVHACVSSLRAFREDCPLLWQKDTLSGSGVDEDDDTDEDTDDEANAMNDEDDKDRTNTESASFGELMRSLRCSRASVIAAATELLMDAVAPDFETAAMSSDYYARSAALSKALDTIDAELSAMDASLAAGAFRLAAAAVHRAVCASLERLITHRAHDDIGTRVASGALGTAGGSLSGTEAPLTEAQHSRVVELASTLEEFLSADNDGVPAQVLVDGEQRLRRLLNLWFTPTVEVVREFWRQVGIVESSGGGARLAGVGGPVNVVRPSHGGGVGPLDLLALLAQRGGVSTDGDACSVVESHASAAAAMEAQAVLGLAVGESVVASFVCRDDHSTLGGRLFVTQTRLGFSPCGVGPDHPHDAHGAFSTKIEHITRAWKAQASENATPALHVLLVDGREVRWGCFVGGARARDLALEGLQASAAARQPNAPFLVNPDTTAPASGDVVLPHGETTRRMVSCALDGFVDKPGTLFVTSAALLWLPGGDDVLAKETLDARGGGTRIAFTEIDASGVCTASRGWRDHCVVIRVNSKAGRRVAPVRFVRLTESSAIALKETILAAMTAFDARRTAVTK